MPETPSDPSAREAMSFVWGARVQRIDAPSPTLYTLTLYDQGEKVTLLFALAPRQADLGLAGERPSGQAASAFVRRLRVAFENARLVSAHWLGGSAPERASAIQLSFLRAGESSGIAVDLDPERPNLYLLGANDAILGAADERTRRLHFPGAKVPFVASLRPPGLPVIHSREEALARGARLLTRGERSSEERLRGQARAQTTAAIKRVTRKAAAIREDLARAGAAPLLRREANLLLCHLSTIPPGSRQVTLEDLSAEPVATVQIELDPSLSAQENAERRFTRARRMERGMTIAGTRLGEAEQELASLTRFAQTSESLDMPSLIREASLMGIKLDAPVAHARARSGKGRQEHVPYRSFQAQEGARILVGKGAADNDELTLTIARPHDLWLHARGLQGAHVIIPRERNAQVPPELLLDAAHLAVHFSGARGEASAEVQYAERRYLRKPKGSAPGAVRVDRERVLLLRVERARLERLLAAENKP